MLNVLSFKQFYYLTQVNASKFAITEIKLKNLDDSDICDSDIYDLSSDIYDLISSDIYENLCIKSSAMTNTKIV